MGLDLDTVPGQTPLTEEERDGLLIPTIATRAELDEFEQQNIERAIRWTLTSRLGRNQILSESFVKRLHQRMFGDVWAWAGTFRKSERNLGVNWLQIPTEVHKLIGDCNYWIDHKTYSPEEIAIRFKHRIVQTHCFPNGNGRHSRLMADLMMQKMFGLDPFSWGSKANLATDATSRAAYIKAVKAADANKFEALIAFARK